jgi:hypothetical protein
LQAYSATDGSLLLNRPVWDDPGWSRGDIAGNGVLGGAVSGDQYFLLPAPVIGNLGDSGLAIIVPAQQGVMALPLNDGQPLWSFPVRHGIRFNDKESDKPFLADLDGTRRRCVCFATRGAQPEVLVIDGQGKERSRRRLTPGVPAPGRTLLWHQDLLGDGKGELLLFVADGKLRATRGGAAPEHALWAWQLPDGGAPVGDLQMLGVQPATEGRPVTVVVQSLAQNVLYGLSGADGSTLWRTQAEGIGGRTLPLFASDGGQFPLVVCVHAGQDTTCRRTLPVDPRGRYQLSEPAKEELAPAANDPRFLRPLPWASLAMFLRRLELPDERVEENDAWERMQVLTAGSSTAAEPAGARPSARWLWAALRRGIWLHPLVLALYLFSLPAWLLRKAWRRRSWLCALLAFGSFILLELVLSLAPFDFWWKDELWRSELAGALFHWIRLPALSGQVPWWARWILSALDWLDWLSPPLLAFLGLPVVIFIRRGVVWGVRRQWRGLALLALLFSLATVLVASVWLWYDTRSLELGQHYSWATWYLVGQLGLYAAAVLFAAGLLLSKLIRFPLSRHRPVLPA